LYNSSQRVKLSSRRTAGYFKRVSRVSRDRLGPRRWLFRINRRREIGFVVRYVRRRRDYLRNRLESSSCGIEREYRQVLGPWVARLGNAEKPSVLLPMCAIPLPSRYFLSPCVFTYENDALRRDGRRSIPLPKRARLHRNGGSDRLHAHVGVTHIMCIPVYHAVIIPPLSKGHIARSLISRIYRSRH